MPAFLPSDAATSVSQTALYEREKMRLATGGMLRPGGLTLTDRLLEPCELPPGSRLLDLGCGYGASLAWLQEQDGYHPVGVDISLKLLREAVRQQLRVTNARVENLPFPNSTFDAILMECSLSTILLRSNSSATTSDMNALGVLNEVKRVLRVGGWLLLSDLYARKPEGLPALRALPAAGCLRGALHLPAIEKSLEESGFAIKLSQDHSGALREFSCQIYQAYGSTQAFWDEAFVEQHDALDLVIKIGQAKPGYFILLAQKQPPCGSEFS